MIATSRRSRRIVAYSLLIGLGLTPWLMVFGAGAYLRSPLRRAAAERELTEFFGLPTRVGRIVPLNWQECRLDDVELFLPNAAGQFNSDDRIAHCRSAHWLRSGQGDQDAPRFDLVLTGGQLDLSPARWARGDFQKIERSLQHDYLELNLDRVTLRDWQVGWGQGDFHIRLGQVAGSVSFNNGPDGQPVGVAEVVAGELNGLPAPVLVTARFDPLRQAVGDGGRCDRLIREFQLITPPDKPIPLAQLNLAPLLGSPAVEGSFTGQIDYQMRRGTRCNAFTLRDSVLTAARLEQLTAALPRGPIAGRLARLELQTLRIEQELDGQREGDFLLGQLRLAGTVNDLNLADVLRTAGLPPCDGLVQLRIEQVDLLPPGPLAELRASGQASGLDLDQLSELLAERFGGGRLGGTLRIENLKLVIEKGELVSFEADLIGVEDRANQVQMKLIRAISPTVDWLERNLPGELPESLGYSRLAVHVFSAGEQLFIQGRGGSDGKSMMTLYIPTPKWYRSLGGGQFTEIDVPAPGLEKPMDLSPVTRKLAQPAGPIALRAIRQTLREKLRSENP